MQPQKTLNEYLAQAIRENWENPALTDLHSNSYTYARVGEYIVRMHLMFRHMDIKKGDHIAICASNSAEWALTFLSAVTYGAVAVSILADFRPEDVIGLVNHSESKLLCVDAKVWRGLKDHARELKTVLGVFDAGNSGAPEAVWQHGKSSKLTKALAAVDADFAAAYPSGLDPDLIEFAAIAPDDTIVINYTSGSTGSPKGVMLTERNMWSNVQYSIDGLRFLVPGDTILSMLPLAHMFGLTVDLLHPFVKGCHIFFLMHAPTPAVLMSAFKEVRPKLVVSVPLVIEKIIKKKVFPVINKMPTRLLLNLPVIRAVVRHKLRRSLIDAFGGRLQELILGGAGVSAEVEKFLRSIQFPFTVGYGMTECGPLIGYAPWNKQHAGTCGHVVDRMQLRIDSEDPARIPGVMWVKGDNVMKGYFHNPEATEAVMGDDGWMNTGDIGTLSSDGLISIKGRDKNMILGPSGQNIYPEEIEAKLNHMDGVGESLVIDEGDGRLLALVYPDQEFAEGKTPQEVSDVISADIKLLNKSLPGYSQVRSFRLMEQEFQKTPKRSIKRFLYTADTLPAS